MNGFQRPVDMQRIVVFSPHLDDAALSACDHILRWKSTCSVSVWTIFTSFETDILSDYQLQFMQRINLRSVAELQQRRVEEDVRAMVMMDVEYRHLGFTDAAFRTADGKLLYPDVKSLFSGCPSLRDAALRNKLELVLSEAISPSTTLVVPLSIGQHCDHIIVKNIAEKLCDQRQLNYFVDIPYARNPRKWSWNQLQAFLRNHRSCMPLSSFKRSILSCYESQMPFLFRGRPLFPEIILGPLAE